MGKRPLLLWALLVCCAFALNAADKRFTLVIDAGHGGHDAGALGSFSKEKNINLNVALAFGRYVERNCPDVRVVYTRTTDKFVPLHERANIANHNKADLFISIHTNALPGGRTARGLETYTLGMHRAADNLDVAKRENSVILVEKDYKQHYEGFDPNSAESYIMFEFLQDKNMAQSVDLAKMVQRRVCATASRPDKGVKQAGFLVLRETSMPSCLIELGFITTADEERMLNTDSGIDNLGRGIYLAFADYKGKYDKTITVPFQAPQNDDVAVQPMFPQQDTPKKTKKSKKKTSQSIIDELASARSGAAQVQTRGVGTDNEGGTDTVAAQTRSAASDRKDASEAPAAKPATQETKSAAQAAKQVAAREVKPAAATGNGVVVPRRTQPVAEAADVPVFKVQILASGSKLKTSDRQFKGAEDIDCYVENGMYKYTIGASADYNEIYRMRKGLLDKFPEAFIIAFKNGQKMDVNQGIREFKSNRNKR